MFRIALAVGATIAAFVPATVGLLGNSSFSEDVPVRVPVGAGVLPAEEPSATPSPVADDHGGDRPRDTRVEPGDDSDASPSASPGQDAGDDHGGHGHGSDDSGGHGSDD